jgi:CHASE3 domain sensor protein
MPQIDELRQGVADAEQQVARLEGTKESAQARVTELEQELSALGDFDPTQLEAQIASILSDAGEVLGQAKTELTHIVGEVENATSNAG